MACNIIVIEIGRIVMINRRFQYARYVPRITVASDESVSLRIAIY